MTVKHVTVNVYHSFDLDIPDDLLDNDEQAWVLDDFIMDAFMDDDDWTSIDFDIE